MRRLRVDDPRDPRVAVYRIVRDPELVRTSDVFLAEGRLVLRALLDTWPALIQSLLVTEVGLSALGDETSQLAHDTQIYVVEPAVMTDIGGIRFHQGCIAAATRPTLPPIEEFLATGKVPARLIYLDGVGNPDNVGTLLRSALALGATGAVVGPKCASPLYRKALRASMGAGLKLRWTTVDDHNRLIFALASEGIDLMALTPTVGAQSLEEYLAGPNTTSAWCLAIGSEYEGVSSTMERAAKKKLRIPMSAGTDSINLAAAAAIALYRLNA